MRSEPRVKASLRTILARRIAFFAVLAMLVQTAVVVSDYYWNDGELSRLFVEQETERLAEGVSVTPAGPVFRLPDMLDARYGRATTGYLARVRSRAGSVLFSSCNADCERHFLPLDVRPPDFWLRTIAPGKPLTLAGGRAFTVGDQPVFIEVVTLGDPQDVLSSVLWAEVLDHMIVPMGILLVLIFGATLLSVRAALKPVDAAALAADALDPMDVRSHLSTQDMPLEIARLATAVNRSFARVGELMTSQKVLTSGIAHEVRTPLAAMKLELSRIDHPRARKAEADLDELVQFVGQLTALARLDSFDRSAFTDVDLAGIAADVVETLAPFVYQHRHSLALDIAGHGRVAAVESLLRDAIRNLVENAVKHTPAGTVITVRVGVDRIDVEDRRADTEPAPDQPRQAAPATSGGLGIGLKIVERIAALHRATLHREQTATGLTVRLQFSPPPPEPAKPLRPHVEK